MKKNYFCMLGAMLICAATVFTGCGNADDPVPGGDVPVIENLPEKVIGKWIVEEKDGKPALTNQKLVIDFKSDTKVTVSLSYMSFWHSNDLFDYTINGNVISCAGQLNEHTSVNTTVKVNAIDDKSAPPLGVQGRWHILFLSQG